MLIYFYQTFFLDFSLKSKLTKKYIYKICELNWDILNYFNHKIMTSLKSRT